MIVYEATNKKNGKVYVGLTTQNLDVRKSQHLRSAKSGSNIHFHKALRKYGEDAFEWSVVFLCDSKESMYEKEKLAIALYDQEQLYNKSAGGEHSAYGMKHTQETKDLCGEYARKRWDGKRATDKYPDWVFNLCSYRVASKFGVPKTTWYRQRRND